MKDRIEWVTDAQRFAALEGSWDALTADDPLPFSCHAWFDAWRRAFGTGARLRICVLWRGGEPAAALPLWRRGRRLEGLANALHTPVFRAPSRDGDALATVAAAALDAADGGELTVEALADGDRELEALRRAARGRRRLVVTDGQHVSPIVDTVGAFDDYRRAMKSGWRELERRRRKMHREHDVRYDLIRSPDDVDRELARGLTVEASGWKGAAGTAIVSSPDTHAFYRAVARGFHRTRRLKLSELWLDGRLVAFDLALLHSGRLHLLKTGYDESVRSLSPGLALRRAVIERCFDLGLEAHELLGDDMPWKRLFATSERRHRRFSVYGRRPVPLARYAHRRGMPELRRLYVRHVKPRVVRRSA
jgi:CelD/BcsL family acetyltransferase involved in cellulose biosynthesis